MRCEALLLLLVMTAGTARAGDCPPPFLGDGGLDLFSFRSSVEPGGTVYFSFGHRRCCYFWDPVPVECVSWQVSPAGAASLNLEGPPSMVGGGWLEVDPAVLHGTVITLRASYDQGLVTLEETFHVYRPEMNPLVGRWREKTRVSCPSFIRGDFDGGGTLEITDAINVFSFQFLGEEGPGCLEAADSNGDGRVDIADGIFILSHLFLGSSPPPSPFPSCGSVPTHVSQACQDSGSCPGAKEVTPENRIEEIIFEADGRFSVTWTPFELYKDYWGTYDFDLGTGTIRFTIISGNNIPGDFLSVGSTFSRVGSDLHLDALWLGSWHEPEERFCGYRLAR